jgi:hypothetical protein
MQHGVTKMLGQSSGVRFSNEKGEQNSQRNFFLVQSKNDAQP